MRVNVYAEELPDAGAIEIIGKEIEGRTFTGVRIPLYLPVTLPNGDQVRGKFMHYPDDDDSSAITIWGKRDLRPLLHEAIARLDDHYAAAQKETALEWSDTLLNGETVTFKKAEKAVKALGDGWRLPTREELESLVDTSRHDPAIDASQFPDTKSTWYWTSTPCAWSKDAVWVVSFYDGYVGHDPRSGNGCVRAVRSGQ